VLSPNFGDRRGGLTPELIVLHYTAMQSCAAAQARLCDPAAEVSAHYLIDVDGRVIALGRAGRCQFAVDRD
jgi:N-acetylmuramoyl-L-alanine amidase